MKLMQTCCPGLLQGLSEHHFGFRPTYQAEESIHSLRLMVEKSREYQLPLIAVKNDVRKAFDRLSHLSIIHALQAAGMDDALTGALIRELRSGHLLFQMADGSECSPVLQTRGVKQGGASSPMLFVVVLGFVLRPLISSWEARGFGFKAWDAFFPCLVFADDIILVATSASQAELMLAELNATLKTAGLDLQLQKSCVCHNNFAALVDSIVVEGVPIPIATADEGLAILGVIVPFDNALLASESACGSQ